MEDVIERTKCTGCTCCINLCPKKAISININEEGFEYPIIDKTKCINCGLCKRKCPVLNKKNNKSLNDCYVAFAKDNKLKNNASSGGIFPLLAKYIIEENGIVIGASLEHNELIHVAIESIKDLDKLKGSKYLQSSLGELFSYIESNVKKRKILFVGTPCQVAGLKSFIKKDYDNLICVDLFCHGVPSPKVYKKYVLEIEKKYNDKLITYKFRDKSTGWDTYSCSGKFTKKEIKEPHHVNDYMKIFLSDVALRESCYNCKFKLGNKYSDLTLGDFWGVDQFYPEMYKKDGVSAIIVNSTKGAEIFEQIKTDLEYKNCKIEEILFKNPVLVTSSKRPMTREKFFNELNDKNISELSKKYNKNKKNILKKIIDKIMKAFK